MTNEKLIKALRVEPFEVESIHLARIMNEAADAIETAEQLQKDGKWISVKDRLPYDDQMVLVPIITKEIPCTEILICRYIKCGHLFRHYGFRGIKDFIEVTHWMPLPEPPKGEQDGNESNH